MKFNKLLTFIATILTVNNTLYAMQENNKDKTRDNNLYCHNTKSNENIGEFNINNIFNSRDEISELNKNLRGNTQGNYNNDINNLNSQILPMLFNNNPLLQLPITQPFSMGSIDMIMSKLDLILFRLNLIGLRLNLLDEQQRTIQNNIEKLNNGLKQLHYPVWNNKKNNTQRQNRNYK